MLKINDLYVSYGPVAAVRGMSLSVAKGEIVAVIGANGAGKSTLMWTISGVISPLSGSIEFEGQSLIGKRPEEVARMGVALVPENRHIFATLSVSDNLRVGAATCKDATLVRADIERMEERFPVLNRLKNQPAGRLSGGEQQQLAIARALISRPQLILLDEPSLGLDPQTTARMFEIVSELRDGGTTVLLVEQNATKSIALADQTYVLRVGEVAMHGTSADLADRTDITDVYLGINADGLEGG